MRLFPERLLWPGLGEGAGRRGPLSLLGHAPGRREVDGKVDAGRHRARLWSACQQSEPGSHPSSALTGPQATRPTPRFSHL